MSKITIKETQNPSILKFEFEDFITKNDPSLGELAKQSFEFKNIDEATNSPLAQKLFYLPFVKTVYISGNFIAIEKFSIVKALQAIESAHLLKALLEVDENVVPFLLKKLKVNGSVITENSEFNETWDIYFEDKLLKMGLREWP